MRDVTRIDFLESKQLSSHPAIFQSVTTKTVGMPLKARISFLKSSNRKALINEKQQSQFQEAL